jgi:hypothetical protein
MKRFATFTAAAVMGLLVVTGCGFDKATEPYKDSARGSTNSGKADLITFPDGFNNVATKCDHGNRVYVTYHADAPYGSITVVPNAKGC